MSEQKTAEDLVRQIITKAVVDEGVPLPAIWKESVTRLCVSVVEKLIGVAALSPKPDRPMLSDERIKAIADAASVLWLPPYDADDSGSFVRTSMNQMRHIVHACIRADRAGQSL